MPKKPIILQIHALAQIPFEIYQEHLTTCLNQNAIDANRLIAPSFQKINLDAVVDGDVHYIFCDFDKLSMDTKNLKLNKVHLCDKDLELQAWYYLLSCYQKMHKLDVSFIKNIKDKMPKEIFYKLTQKN